MARRWAERCKARNHGYRHRARYLRRGYRRGSRDWRDALPISEQNLMRRALRWLRNALLGLAAIIVIAALVIYVRSEQIVRRTYAEPLAPIAIPTDSASIAEGMRVARIRGCTGCHGSKLEGQMFVDDPMLARLASPDLTIAAREYSDAELVRIIRRGVRPDGRSVVGMPSDMFSQLDDRDVGMIIAYLRSVPPSAGQRRGLRLGPIGRVGVAAGKFLPAAAEARRADALSSSYPRGGDSTARGAYLARTVCTECHALDLGGGDGTPDLRIAAGYSLERFVLLMRTGKALGDREVGLMSKVARGRFSHFTDGEIQALHAYLKARAAAPQPTPAPK